LVDISSKHMTVYVHTVEWWHMHHRYNQFRSTHDYAAF